MQIQISESAYDDLNRGYSFYESQREGLGNYFQESLFQRYQIAEKSLHGYEIN